MRALILSAILAGVVAAGATPAAAQRPAVTPVAYDRMAPAPRIAPPAPPADAWWGEDKVQHFVASAAVTTMAYGAARVPLDSDEAIVAAIGTAALAGLWKEWRDLRSGGPFSFRDLVYDALGIAVGYVWIREIE